jgi:hypothetical protein
MLVPPLKRERTESSRGRLNIRVLITEFYLRSPGRFAGLFVAGSKSESPAAKRGFSAADSPVPQAGADKLPDPRCRAAKARHDGRRPIALPSSWPRCYPRNRAEPIVETHHLSRRYTRLVRHVAAPFDQAAAQNSLTERCRGRGGDIPYMVRGLTQKQAHCEIQIGPLGIALVSRTKSSWHFKPWLARQASGLRRAPARRQRHQLSAFHFIDPQRGKASTHDQSSPKSGESAIIESIWSPSNFRFRTLARRSGCRFRGAASWRRSLIDYV